VEAIVLAGGFGTRLQGVINDRPKSMALINGRPFLEYLLDYLIRQGISRTVLSVGFKRDSIISHFGADYRGMEIDYAIEEEPMGTGGGIRLGFWKIKADRAVVMNGDSLFMADIGKMGEKHLVRKADVTLALRKLDDTGRYGRVVISSQGRIKGFEEKNQQAGPGYISAGVYFMEKSFIMEPRFRGRFSIEKECFERYFSSSRMFGFPADGYFIDIGIPEDYEKAQHEFATIEN
jgi:D-glycero-alpha-D-manno-heptose 1-phosphate guanylyltransferase